MPDMRCFAIVLTVEIDHTDASPNPAEWDWSELLGVSGASVVDVSEVKDEPSALDIGALHEAGARFVDALAEAGLLVRED